MMDIGLALDHSPSSYDFIFMYINKSFATRRVNQELGQGKTKVGQWINLNVAKKSYGLHSGWPNKNQDKCSWLGQTDQVT